MNPLALASGGQLIVIDGKSLRRSFEHPWDTSGMAHVVIAEGKKELLAMVDDSVRARRAGPRFS